MQRSLALLGHVSSEHREHSKESGGGGTKGFFNSEKLHLETNRTIHIWIIEEKGLQQTSFITNFSLSTGDTVKTARGFPLSSGNAGTWRATVAANRPGSLRGKIQPLRKTLILIKMTMKFCL